MKGRIMEGPGIEREMRRGGLFGPTTGFPYCGGKKIRLEGAGTLEEIRVLCDMLSC